MYRLEDGIMKVWQSKDDLETLYKNIERLSEDQLLNTLLGLIELVDMRCSNLFETYEEVLRSQC